MGKPEIPVADLEKVANGLAAGRRQRQIATDEGWTPAKVTRCVERMREVILDAGGDKSWLDTKEKSAGEVAQEWLRLRLKSATPAAPAEG